MGGDCCKQRPDDPQSEPSKQSADRLKRKAAALQKDLSALLEQVMRLKKADVLQPEAVERWERGGYETYIAFLSALEKQAAVLKQSPAIPLLGRHIDSETPEQREERVRVMGQFITELKAFNQPGDLPDAEWLLVVKQTIGKKQEFANLRTENEELKARVKKLEGRVEAAKKAVHSSSDKGAEDIKALSDQMAQIQSTQRSISATIDGCARVAQGGERIFQEISSLSRMALGMQAAISQMAHQEHASEPKVEEPTAEEDEFTIEVRETVG